MSIPTSETFTDAIQTLKLRLCEADVREVMSNSPESSHASIRQFLVELAAKESCERDARNLKRRLHEACLPRFTPLDKFDWNHPRAIDRGLYKSLLDLEFIRNAENILFRGPSGVGKSTLAANLGHAAIQAGYRVRFTSLSEALADLLRQESLPAFERRKRKYSTPHVLIIDELGYVPCDTRAADILYAIIAARHEQTSSIITTNLAFKQWPDVFPGAACVSALVDRFIQHCHVLDIDADSWRRKTAEQRAGKKKPAPKAPRKKSIKTQ